MQTTNLNQMLFHLTLCKGIGATSRIRMLSALIDNPNLTAYELARYAQLNSTNTRLFMDSFVSVDLEKSLNEYDSKQIKWISILDKTYPEYLKHIYNPPALLFYQGDLSLFNQQLLAIVGSRLTSSYGEKALTLLLPELISHEIATVSGLAKGIDKEVHQKTIELGGRTIGIIGTGLDYFYPFENESLQRDIARNHLLISEYPLGTKPLKHHFPMRNRIIAGLSLGTLVIEAKYRSGSLITANLALQEGREVFAVPGNITNPYSEGTNDLILHGAKCVLSPQHILEELNR
ncbi:DNA-processing protein DprA [Carnobacterium viridans]|uniref:DNA processing protein n=1 Tax=Carnobacterium viridans TaxID=174587 RepID=A0A1H0Y593_9LACT|nr:DNA-processing protein DprA [Carnobacterium viridans]UDE95342.1 DNA-processing protein DprA [Carnobacterium viridans]SDQ10292.1 DNA processing protein [Carnobacterium viridans]